MKIRNVNPQIVTEKGGIYIITKSTNLPNKNLTKPNVRPAFTQKEMDRANARWKICKGDEILAVVRSNNLNRRFKQFLSYGKGTGTCHKGERFLFTIPNWNELEIEFIECNQPRPEKINRLKFFLMQYHHLPFANHRMN